MKSKHLCTLIAVTAVSFLLSSAPRAYGLATEFLNFDVEKSVAEQKESCLTTKGQWGEVATSIGFVTSAYICKYQKQAVKTTSNKFNTVVEPVNPKLVFFGVLENKLIFVDYMFSFKTWSMRNDFKFSLISKLKTYFPLSVKRLSATSYKLQNTEYFLEFVNYDHPEKNEYVVHIFISNKEDGMNNYIYEGVELQ